jgi:hypothetical protein
MKGKVQYGWLKHKPYDDGRIIRIYCKTLGPNLAKTSDGVFVILNAILGISLFAMWIDAGWNLHVGFLWGGHALIFTLLFNLGFQHWIARLLFGRRMDIVLSKDFIKLGGWFGYKTYPNMIINFTNKPHPKAEQEALEEKKKGKVITPYFRKTQQIILYNGEIPHILASVYNSEKAVTAIIIRLQTMQEVIKQLQMQARST